MRLVTVRAGRDARGRVMTSPRSGRPELEEQLAHIRIGFGGMIAESVAELGSGAGNGADTATATGIAISLVDENGLGRRSLRFNPRALAGPMRRPPSEELLRRLDEDAAQLLEDAYGRAEKTLFGIGRATILRLAGILVQRQWLTGPAFEEAAQSAGARV